MNYIPNWFHFYETTESFEVHRKQGLINPDSICFLHETGQIYTQNTFYGICKERYERLEQLVLEHDAKIKNILGTEGPSVNDGIVNNIADLVNFLDGFTDQDNLKEFIEAIKATIIEQIETVNEELSSRITVLENEISNENEELHTTIDSINGRIDTINIRLDNHDTSISSLNTALSAHIREYNLLKTNYDNFKSYTTTKFNSIDSSITSLTTSVNFLQLSFTELDEKFNNVENEIALVQSYLEDAKKLVQELETRFEDTLASLEEFKRGINIEINDFKSSVGAPDGIAPLDSNSKVPSTYLPSYVDDVLEYPTLAAFPTTGESGKIYVALDNDLTYRWSGSTYTEISKSLALGETTTTAYAGSKGKKNADDIAAHKADYNNPHRVTRAQLGLDRVNNTSDADKPISNAQQAALDILTNSLEGHVTDRTNPHQVTKSQVGLGKVDNTADSEKPVSAATQAALNTKVDKIVGKGLSTNDFTNEYKTKIDEGLSYVRRTSEQLESYIPEREGDIVYVTDTNEYKYWNGTEWREYGVTSDSINEMLLTKADISELSNVVEAERVMDIDTYPNIDVNLTTREQLKKDLFIDLWNQACGRYGTYNETTGYFELNGILDIGYEEALRIYEAGPINSTNLALTYSGLEARTNLPVHSMGFWCAFSTASRFRIEDIIRGNEYFEVLNLSSLNLIQSKRMALVSQEGNNLASIQSPILKKIIGGISIDSYYNERNNKIFGFCENLESVEIYGLRRDFTISGLPKLNLESFQCLINSASNNNNEITLTVHPDVYAKLMGDTTNAIAASLTLEELAKWQEVLTTATAKNIQIVTA